MRVARKIVWVMLATFFGVFAVLGYLDARRVVDEYHARIANELATTGRALSPALAEVEAVEGRGRLLRLLDRADRDLSDVQLAWRQLDDPQDSREPRLDAAQRASLTRGEEVSFENERTNRLYVFVPVGSATGAIEVSQDLMPRNQLVSRTIKRRFTLGGIAVLVAAGFSIFAALWVIGAPMQQLAAHARQIGAGDLSHRLSLRRRDEIGELASEMNAMSDRLLHAQQAKTQAEEQLRHADRMRTVGTLAAGMAHELGTPLGVIAGRARMIATADGASPPIVQYAEIISRQVERMTTLMRGVLGFARRSPPTKTTTNLYDLTKRILDLVGPVALARQVLLDLDGDPEAASAAVDAAQVEQALANIVLNAVQAMSGPGSVRASVRPVRMTAPESAAQRDYVRICVRDTGSGIRPEDLPRVFEPFFTTKPVGSGTGLGLSVAYAIVREHGGFIDVKSVVDQGTTVSLHFPV